MASLGRIALALGIAFAGGAFKPAHGLAFPTCNATGAFAVHQVAKPLGAPKTVNPPAVYAKALGKYGADVPAHVWTAAVTGSAATIPTEYETAYLTPVTVGGTTMYLIIDTGSADLWVFSSELPRSYQTGHNVYNVDFSKRIPNYSWSITYGDGSAASGNVFRDSVSIGGVATAYQAVEAAQVISNEFLQSPSDGIMGMAFSSLNMVRPRRQNTFLTNILPQLNYPIVAVTLKHSAVGSYDFGFVDSSKYVGVLAIVPVDDSRGWWAFTADGYAVGGGQSIYVPINAIVDTGTTLLLLPTAIVRDYYSRVSGATNSRLYGGYVFPCRAELPSFTAIINGYRAVVSGSYINFAPVSTDSSVCYGGIQDSAGIGFAIFGEVFLKSQYVVFDAAGLRMAFAPQS